MCVYRFFTEFFYLLGVINTFFFHLIQGVLFLITHIILSFMFGITVQLCSIRLRTLEVEVVIGANICYAFGANPRSFILILPNPLLDAKPSKDIQRVTDSSRLSAICSKSNYVPVPIDVFLPKIIFPCTCECIYSYHFTPERIIFFRGFVFFLHFSCIWESSLASLGRIFVRVERRLPAQVHVGAVSGVGTQSLPARTCRRTGTTFLKQLSRFLNTGRLLKYS